MLDTDAQIANFRARVAVMRELGCSRWDGIELGPEPLAAAEGDETQQPQLTPAQVAARALEERRRITLGATGRLVKRADGPLNQR